MRGEREIQREREREGVRTRQRDLKVEPFARPRPRDRGMRGENLTRIASTRPPSRAPQKPRAPTLFNLLKPATLDLLVEIAAVLLATTVLLAATAAEAVAFLVTTCMLDIVST